MTGFDNNRFCYCYFVYIFSVCLFSIYLFIFLFRWKTDVGTEDWSFSTKLTDLSENFEDEGENGYPELEIFQVKFLGCSTIHAAKSEEATANTIKSIITAAKGEYPLIYVKQR